MSKGPARGYSWPSFEANHELSMRHGAYAERRIRPLAERLQAEIKEVAPWLQETAFAPAVAAWSRAEAQVQLLTHYLEEVGNLDDHGKPRPATALLERTEIRARKLRGDLALDPQNWARLLGTLEGLGETTRELDDLVAVGRRILEERP